MSWEEKIYIPCSTSWKSFPSPFFCQLLKCTKPLLPAHLSPATSNQCIHKECFLCTWSCHRWTGRAAFWWFSAAGDTCSSNSSGAQLTSAKGAQRKLQSRVETAEPSAGTHSGLSNSLCNKAKRQVNKALNILVRQTIGLFLHRLMKYQWTKAAFHMKNVLRENFWTSDDELSWVCHSLVKIYKTQPQYSWSFYYLKKEKCSQGISAEKKVLLWVPVYCHADQ